MSEGETVEIRLQRVIELHRSGHPAYDNGFLFRVLGNAAGEMDLEQIFLLVDENLREEFKRYLICHTYGETLEPSWNEEASAVVCKYVKEAGWTPDYTPALTLEEAVNEAKARGLLIPEDYRFVLLKAFGGQSDIFFGGWVGTPLDEVTWDSLYEGGVIPIGIHQRALADKEGAINVIAYAVFLLELLHAKFDQKKKLLIAEVHRELVNRMDNSWFEATRKANRFTWPS